MNLLSAYASTNYFIILGFGYLVIKGTYTAVLFSLVIHGVILLLIIVTQQPKQLTIKPPQQNKAIKSYLYSVPNSAPKITETKLQPIDEAPQEAELSKQEKNKELNNKLSTNIPEDISPPDKSTSDVAPSDESKNAASLDTTLPEVNVLESQPKPAPMPAPVNRKLDSFTQLQRLRSKLNNSAAIITDGPYQKYQPPSAFNPNAKSVPHSVPLKDEEKERRKNTKNMGSGIAITKGDDGVCEIRQDLSVYGLTEGSSIQKFSCGESKFDKSFREHMKKVKTKIGK